LKHRFIEFTNVIFKTSRRLIMSSKLHFPFLKHHLSNIIQVAFFGDPGFGKCMPFRHIQTTLQRIFQNHFLRLPEGWLLILRPIRPHKTSLKWLRPRRFFRCTRCRKWVRMAFRRNEISLHRLHQSRFLRRTEGRL
jgi:hypothetical protein